jgi:hypothetical protein
MHHIPPPASIPAAVPAAGLAHSPAEVHDTHSALPPTKGSPAHQQEPTAPAEKDLLVTALTWTLAALCGISLAEVALFALRVRHLRTLSLLEPADLGQWPRVSVIVPARDEARGIGPALASRLADDYPMSRSS